MLASLSSLPPELYTAIFNQAEPEHLQSTVLALSRTLPTHPVPVYHIFECIRLHQPQRVVQLERRLRTGLDERLWVKEFSLESWIVDPDVLINLIKPLPNLCRLSLFIGPSWGPDHLDDLFDGSRWPELRFLSLKFKPYVQKATYLQFMKGAYFDGALDALSKWPESKIQTISIVQDPLDPAIAKKQTFAQPLVFFHLDPFTRLVRSPYLRSASHFRLRVPSRQVARYLHALPGSLPRLEILDLSTCNVNESDVVSILGRFTMLRHLVLDNCGVIRGELREGQWSDFGKSCATAAVKRAKDREKKLKTWLEITHARTAGDVDANIRLQGGQVPTKAPKRGRRGLATATISLRASPPRDAVPLPIPVVNDLRAGGKIPKIRILPSYPSLLSFTTTVRLEDRRDVARAEFEKGWTEGLAQVASIRTRLRQSAMNGVRVMKFLEDEQCMFEEGLEDLDDVEEEDWEVDIEKLKHPSLCLAGPDRQAEHFDGCGHYAAWGIWRDIVE
ncbi:hypothetical protein JAAARDRAFT_29150 [Jaapia argillacea MUCL 33604]|uniref:F-box domain-containing protein n=1 Tax=Jaapia argillacea MUCL 33604 TaxID=933084 RepID=A0A067Q7X5_9AGAM|nr:hypothetical protein JAAARDRAFT_29150 [Jaapia argillacea MUCL 33604]